VNQKRRGRKLQDGGQKKARGERVEGKRRGITLSTLNTGGDKGGWQSGFTEPKTERRNVFPRRNRHVTMRKIQT